MVQRRAREAGLSTDVCNHTFRGTGITAYLENGGMLEKARQMAAHASTRTTQLYDRREDRVTLDEVVKINIRGSSSQRQHEALEPRGFGFATTASLRPLMPRLWSRPPQIRVSSDCYVENVDEHSAACKL